MLLLDMLVAISINLVGCKHRKTSFSLLYILIYIHTHHRIYYWLENYARCVSSGRNPVGQLVALRPPLGFNVNSNERKLIFRLSSIANKI